MYGMPTFFTGLLSGNNLSVTLTIYMSNIMYNARHPDVLLKTIKIYKYRQNTTKFIILYQF